MSLDVDKRAVEAFVADLFGDVPTDERIVVCRFNPGHVTMCKTPAAAAQAVARDPLDVYVGLATMPATLGAGRRGGVADTRGLCGVWLDIDCRDAHHKSTKQYPPDIASARMVVRDMPLRPTYVVATGGGLHAYYLFREYWRFASDAERVRAMSIAQGWQSVAHRMADGRTWQLDATQDIARVLRVPGSYNNKTGTPKLAQIIEHNPAARYEPDDIFDLCPADAVGVRSVKLTPLNVTPDNVNSDEVFALVAPLMEVPRFNVAWRRADKRAGKSASEYDFEIACIMAECEFSDADIARAITVSRRQNGDKDKTSNRAYLPTTIAKAREAVARSEALDAARGGTVGMVEKVDEVTGEVTLEPMPADDARRAALAMVSKAVGVPILAVYQYVGDVYAWKVVTRDGVVNLPSAAHIISRSLFATAMAEAARVSVRIDKESWPDIAECLLKAATCVDLGEDVSMAGLARAWLTGYCRDMRPEADVAKHAGALRGGRPIVRDGEIMFTSAALLTWISRAPDSGVRSPTHVQVARHLAELKLEKRSVRTGAQIQKVWAVGAVLTAEVLDAIQPAPVADIGEEVPL